MAASATLVLLLAGLLTGGAQAASDAATLLKLASVWGTNNLFTQSWKLKNPCSKWYGVTCSGPRGFTVTSLNLYNAGVQGPILPDIARLKSLTSLNISSSDFSNSIMLGPPKDLFPGDSKPNVLQGALPQASSTMTQLQVLALGSPGHIAGNWSLIAKLTQLRGLDLQGRESWFAGSAPRSLSAFTRLTHLDLGFCGFSGSFPAPLKSLTQLEVLRLAKNNFSGRIPSSLRRFTKLKVLTLSGNNFGGGSIPSFLGSLRRLRVLNLDGVQGVPLDQRGFFGGPIPDFLGNLKNLKALTLSAHNLSATFPAALGNLRKLTLLLVAGNNLMGSLPDALSGMVSLQYGAFLFNNLQGEVPASLVNLPKLRGLDLSHNLLSGKLPKLPKLNNRDAASPYGTWGGLWFGYNYLTGGPCSDSEAGVTTDMNCIARCQNQKSAEECQAFRNGTKNTRDSKAGAFSSNSLRQTLFTSH